MNRLLRHSTVALLTLTLSLGGLLAAGAPPAALTRHGVPQMSLPRVVSALTQQAALSAPAGATDDQFGDAVALSADGATALVGANQYFNDGPGAAYVFTRSGSIWRLQQRLTATHGATGDQFGWSVALSADGTTALVGTPKETVAGHRWQGAVYAFVRHGRSWTAPQELAAADGATDDQWGWSVALSADGNTALIGDAFKTVGRNRDQGAAYVFVRGGSSWSQQQRLSAADGATLDDFGDAVALGGDGTTALIGAAKDYNLRSPGVAYVFVRRGNTWSQQQRLAAADGAARDLFGLSVALSADGTTALIGANGATGKPMGHNQSQGAAYVFMRRQSTWSQQQRLAAADGTAGGFFGSAVALSGDGHSALITGRHGLLFAVYLFARAEGSWSQQQEVAPSHRAFSDDFGASVATSRDGRTVLAGADDRNVGSNSRQGAAYVFGPPTQITAPPTSGTVASTSGGSGAWEWADTGRPA